MTSTYATEDDLTARLSSAYTTPPDAATLLAKASELVDHVTRGRAEVAWEADDASATAVALTKATCDQVEYWLEVGEEHDVVGLKGSLQGGRVQLSPVPGALGPRTRRTLLTAGLIWAGADIF